MTDEMPRHTNNPCDLEPRGYDGFGAPIYDHQEDPMPTDLPPGFKGTKPDPDDSWVDVDDEKTTPGERAAMIFAGLLIATVGLAVAFAIAGALCYLGLWFFTHLP